jgi:hypothetical protein
MGQSPCSCYNEGKTYHHGGLPSVFHLDLAAEAASGRHVDGVVGFDACLNTRGSSGELEELKRDEVQESMPPDEGDVYLSTTSISKSGLSKAFRRRYHICTRGRRSTLCKKYLACCLSSQMASSADRDGVKPQE